MYEWIAKLANSQGRCNLDKPIVWAPELVRRLEVLGDKIARAVDHWFDQIIGRFITEFTVDMTINYNEAE